MKSTRFSRLMLACIALFSLLFTQLALAAYVCPTLDSDRAAQSILMIDPDMPGCQGMPHDVQAPGLCAAHCDKTPQSADTPSAPAVTLFIAGALALVLDPDHALQALVPLPERVRPGRAGAPPLIIRNCCLRI